MERIALDMEIIAPPPPSFNFAPEKRRKEFFEVLKNLLSFSTFGETKGNKDSPPFREKSKVPINKTPFLGSKCGGKHGGNVLP